MHWISAACTISFVPPGVKFAPMRFHFVSRPLFLFGSAMSDLPVHVRRNRSAWDAWAKEYVAPAERLWTQTEPTCGSDCCDEWIFPSRIWSNCAPDERATTRYSFVIVDWARRWPAEEVWRMRKSGEPNAGNLAVPVSPLGR